MSKTVTLRIKDSVYQRLRTLAERDNRPLSNYIETAALRYIEQEEFVDEFEMLVIKGNKSLNESIEQGITDAKEKRGQFV
jgi:hypothetical protein